MELEHNIRPSPATPTSVEVSRLDKAQAAVTAAQAAVTQAEQAYTAATAALATSRFELLEANQRLQELT
jgi:multidrug resistance efflux pump